MWRYVRIQGTNHASIYGHSATKDFRIALYRCTFRSFRPKYFTGTMPHTRLLRLRVFDLGSEKVVNSHYRKSSYSSNNIMYRCYKVPKNRKKESHYRIVSSYTQFPSRTPRPFLFSMTTTFSLLTPDQNKSSSLILLSFLNLPD
jgi:hypothetical protein